MFIDQMPTKRVNIDQDNWAEVQYLSVGIKDEQRARAINFRENEDKEKVYRALKEIEYLRVVAGVRRWSSDKDITLETVKALHEDAFNKILEAVDTFNTITEEEAKN